MYLTNVGTPYLQHIECNVFDNILKHLFGEWDTMEMCKDMEEVEWNNILTTCLGWTLCETSCPMCVHPTWTQKKKKKKYLMIIRQNILRRIKIQFLLDFISKVHASTWYVTTFKKHVGPNRLFNFKKHDHHVMIQHELPSGIKSLLQPRPIIAII
jgi:hypothetical protein